MVDKDRPLARMRLLHGPAKALGGRQERLLGYDDDPRRQGAEKQLESLCHRGHQLGKGRFLRQCIRVGIPTRLALQSGARDVTPGRLRQQEHRA